MRFGEAGRIRRLLARGGAAVPGLLLFFVAAHAEGPPLSVDECVQMALRNNPALAMARWQLSGTEASRLSTYSAYLPAVSLQNNYVKSVTQFDQPKIDPNSGLLITSTTRSVNDYYVLQGTVTQNLVSPPAWFQNLAAGATVAAVRQGLRATEADVAFRVRQQYFLLLGAILLEDVSKEALSVSQDQLKKAEALFELGSVARRDVLQARVNRANQERAEIQARTAVEWQRAQLAALLGLDVQEPLEIRLDVADPIAAEVPDESSSIREALDLRPEVKRAEAELRGARLSYRSSFWSLFPTLHGTLFYSRQADALSRVIKLSQLDQNAQWGFAIGLRWDIFDGLATWGDVQRAKAEVSSAREARREQELAAALAVREAQIAIQNARDGVRAAEEGVGLAEENLKLQQALYENGGGTMLELNDAQVQWTRAKHALVEARIELHVALAQLDRAVGR